MLIADSNVPMEYLGLIPAFFAEASKSAVDTSGVAKAMDDLYGYGGFHAYPFDGRITDSGTYESDCGDPPLEPDATLYNRGYICRIYPYSIVALTGDDGKTFIARFD